VRSWGPSPWFKKGKDFSIRTSDFCASEGKGVLYECPVRRGKKTERGSRLSGRRLVYLVKDFIAIFKVSWRGRTRSRVTERNSDNIGKRSPAGWAGRQGAGREALKATDSKRGCGCPASAGETRDLVQKGFARPAQKTFS